MTSVGDSKFQWGSLSGFGYGGFLEVLEEETKQHRVPKMHVDTPVSLLAQRKKTAGRYYYHPAPLAPIAYRRNTAVGSVMWKTIGYYPDEITAAFPVGGGTMDPIQVYEHLFRALTKSPLLESPGVDSEATIRELERTVRSLESQIKNDNFHLRLYRLGAGAFLFGAGSLVIRAFTGLGAPLHPVFAAMVIPVSIVLMIMAFLARPDSKQPSQ
jgi:hypothetical protein